jgi:hypothetical protein
MDKKYRRREVILAGIVLPFVWMNPILAQVSSVEINQKHQILVYNLKRLSGQILTSQILEYKTDKTPDKTTLNILLDWLSDARQLNYDSEGIRQVILKMMQKDFNEEQVVCSNGWWLSRTEFHLNYLISQYSEITD